MNCLTCQEFGERLNDVLDLRQAPQQDRSLTEHARGCPACKRRLATQQSIIYAISAKDDAHVTSTFWHSTFWHSTSHAAGPWFTVSAAVAAAITITITLAAPTPDAPEQRVAVTSRPSGNESVTDASDQRSTPPALDSDAASITMDAPIESWSEFIASSTSNTDWLEPVASPIRPLAHSMTSTFNVLRQTLPRTRRDDKPSTELLESAHKVSPRAHFA